MKRFVVLLLCAVLILGCVGCSQDKPGAVQEKHKGLMVGYGRANVTPTLPVGLTGFGNASTRISDNLLSYLYLTCLALTDEQGTTSLLFGVDATTSAIGVTNALRNAVFKATGVPEENIMISATHTHSAPEIDNPIFQSLLLEGAVQAAHDALADQAPVTVEVGTVTTDKLNFVRHYVQENGAYVGNNFGDYSASPIVGHTTQADRQMYLIRFRRDTKDIVLMNFQAHPTMTGGASKYDISADFVGACREMMERELDCNFLYFTGAGGNLNTTSKIPEENLPEIDYRIHGRTLAQYAIDAMDTLTPVDTGRVQVLNQVFQGKCSQNEDENLIEYVPLVNAAYNSGGAAAAQRAGRPYGINSIYHARAISRRASGSYGDHMDVGVSTVAIGDVAFVLAPYEMFDVQGQQIRSQSPYKMTFVLTTANDGFSYIAPEYAFDHGCYEVDMRYFVRGTAEQLVDCYLDMLHTMKEE